MSKNIIEEEFSEHWETVKKESPHISKLSEKGQQAFYSFALMAFQLGWIEGGAKEREQANIEIDAAYQKGYREAYAREPKTKKAELPLTPEGKDILKEREGGEDES